MDFLSIEDGKGGVGNILVITDHFTKYAQAYPTTNQTAHSTAKVLFENVVLHYGFPEQLHSDQGRNFESNVIQNLCKLANVKKSRTTPYHPMGNGITERFNRTLLGMLRSLSEDEKKKWKNYLQPLVHAYNCSKHSTTGYSPFYLMFGRKPRLAIDVIFGIYSGQDKTTSHSGYVASLKERLRKAYEMVSSAIKDTGERHKKLYDSRIRGVTIEVGDHVLAKNVLE
jgi:transposase InsO family protein